MRLATHRLLCRLFRGCKERADLDIEAEVGEGRGNHLLAAIMPVLTHLGDEHAGAAAKAAFVLLRDNAIPFLKTAATKVGDAFVAGLRLLFIGIPTVIGATLKGVG